MSKHPSHFYAKKDINLLLLADPTSNTEIKNNLRKSASSASIAYTDAFNFIDLYAKTFASKVLPYDYILLKSQEPPAVIEQYLSCLNEHFPGTLVIQLCHDPSQFNASMLKQLKLEVRVLPCGDLGLFQLQKLLCSNLQPTTASSKQQHPTTEKMGATQELSWIQKRYEILLNEAGEGIVGLDNDGTITFANPTAGEIFGASPNQLMGRNMAEFTLDSPLKAGSCATSFVKERRRIGRGVITKPNNKLLYVEYTQSFVGDYNNEDDTVSVMIIEDISERIKFESKLKKLAHIDALTGLYNRYYFERSFKHELASRRYSNDYISLALIDLDNFKRINDEYGHSMGDKLLLQVAKRLKDQVRRGDLVARFGGDEFVILLKTPSLELTKDITEKLHYQMQLPFFVGDSTLNISASIGVTAVDNNETISAAMEKADQAMYSVKYNGKNGIMIS